MSWGNVKIRWVELILETKFTRWTTKLSISTLHFTKWKTFQRKVFLSLVAIQNCEKYHKNGRANISMLGYENKLHFRFQISKETVSTSSSEYIFRVPFWIRRVSGLISVFSYFVLCTRNFLFQTRTIWLSEKEKLTTACFLETRLILSFVSAAIFN